MWGDFGGRSSDYWPSPVFVCLSSPKTDVRRAPVLDAIICCVGEMAAAGSLAGRSPILPVCQNTKTPAEPRRLADTGPFTSSLLGRDDNVINQCEQQSVIQQLKESVKDREFQFSLCEVKPGVAWRGAAAEGGRPHVKITYQQRAARLDWAAAGLSGRQQPG